MNKANQKQVTLAKDIMAFALICVRMGFEDSLNNQKLFVEMCNEAGFRTVTGKEFSQMSYRHLFGRLPMRAKQEIKDMMIDLPRQHASIQDLDSSPNMDY